MEIMPKSISSLSLNAWINSEAEKPIIIDVRESLELSLASFPYTDIHMPMSEVTIEFVKSQLKNYLEDRKFVILCHKGIRSYNFGIWLLDNRILREVWNLNDGIDGWSIEVDSKVPRY
tara:strand:- start:1335 stop:1688 length:354 start_codon:yes stop_codon:yes gene_type:complete